MLSGRYDVVILDEVNVALHLGLLELSEVVSLIREKPPAVHLILSGRNAHEEVIRLAHLVTEMRNIKHPYELGIEAEKGIDYFARSSSFTGTIRPASPGARTWGAAG